MNDTHEMILLRLYDNGNEEHECPFCDRLIYIDMTNPLNLEITVVRKGDSSVTHLGYATNRVPENMHVMKVTGIYESGADRIECPICGRRAIVKNSDIYNAQIIKEGNGKLHPCPGYVTTTEDESKPSLIALINDDDFNWD